MFNHIQKAVKRIWRRYIGNLRLRDGKLPKVAPSVAEAILPLETDAYAIAPNQLKDMMNSGTPFVLLDVREEWEYQMVHLEGCRLDSLRRVAKAL